MKRIYLLISLFAAILLLFSCGGGGGDEEEPTPTDPSTVFDLAEFNAIYAGKSYDYYLTGKDNNGESWTMSISSLIGAVENIDGVEYIPEEILLETTYDPTNETVTGTENHYYSLSGEPVYFNLSLSTGENMECVAVTVHMLADSVLIGDTGDTTSYSCYDFYDLNKTTIKMISGTWSVENANDGYAYLIINTVTWNLAGYISDTEIDVFKIDASGNIISLSITTYNADIDRTVYLSTS
ncbi:MAG: hypothetical protein ABFS39_06330 [Pseudomonadota bacterium]